ncbi:MAG TPA: hypothetical protein PKW95_08855 [bacterium]|nr:hypothetical protein [bacterium]
MNKEVVAISLQESMFVYRLLAKLRIFNSPNRLNLLHAWIFSLSLWTLCFFLAFLDGSLLPEKHKLSMSMLEDIVIYAICILGFPLLLYGMSRFQGDLYILSRWLQETGPVDDHEGVKNEIHRINRQLGNKIIDIVALVSAVFGTLLWACGELCNTIPSWHGWISRGSFQIPSLGFFGAFFVTMIYAYLIYSVLIRAIIYMVFVYKLPQFGVNINVMHPDKCGGLSILSWPQVSLGLILANVGIIIVSIIINNTVWLGESIFRNDHATMLCLYAVSCPILFFIPITSFTPYAYNELAQFKIWVNDVSNYLLTNIEDKITYNNDINKLNEASMIVQILDKLESSVMMRLIPFDMKSLRNFMGIVFVPLMALIIPHAPQTIQIILNYLTNKL